MMLEFSYKITKSSFIKIAFIITITLIRSFVLLLPAYLIKVIVNDTLPSKNIMSLVLIATLIAVIPFFTNFLISIDLKLSSYVLGNGELLAKKRLSSVIFLGVQDKYKSKVLHILANEIPNVAKFYFRNVGSVIWILGTNLVGFGMVLKSNLLLGTIFVGTILLGGLILFPFYKKYMIIEEELNDIKIIQNNQSVFLDEIKDGILINDKIPKKLVYDFKLSNANSTILQKKIVRQEQKILFFIDFLKKLIIFEIFFGGFFILRIHNIGVLVESYQISIWLLPSVTLLIQIILSTLNILPQINNINKNNFYLSENELQMLDVKFSGEGLEIISGKLGDFDLKRKLSLNYGAIYSLEGNVGVGKTTVLTHLSKDLKKKKYKVWLSSSRPIIFNDTIKNNILLGQKISKDEFEEKLIKYGFSEKILSRLDESIDEVKVSGGEAQMIELARLLLGRKNPDLIIFDESFSALDNVTFNKVWKGIMSNFKDRIILVISHNMPKQIEIGKEIQFADYFRYGGKAHD
ncbi:ABC transporter ATP-binding protein/permease [Lactobacillus sp. DCY120]|uniref:ABC transporter ATP-binding protein/permease n=1 Tax=Bombilactobacillus apium TaxID=2675299 RepID=A0A850RD22_9LACO|nr:ATP-binding cassette domain-containing protein [Bombilactobacillus apium]NVY97176.1 ABC transporter ATP-binding protein/permease [Bombilactobacillus apium]